MEDKGSGLALLAGAGELIAAQDRSRIDADESQLRDVTLTGRKQRKPLQWTLVKSVPFKRDQQEQDVRLVLDDDLKASGLKTSMFANNPQKQKDPILPRICLSRFVQRVPNYESCFRMTESYCSIVQLATQ